MKKYVAPELHVDEFVPDTMIASGAKNENAGNNQNCWGCNSKAGETDPGNSENACFYLPGTAAYSAMC